MKAPTIASAAAVVLLLGPSVVAQTTAPPDRARRAQDFMVLAGRGAEIGVQIAESAQGGVVVEEVRPDSPAEKAGLKRSDLIVEFDGERVRSARQFSRLVQETPPGRAVKATVMRDGQKREVEITPRGPVPFDLHLPGASGRRLGVTTQELTDQLARYFGARSGVLVTSVADGSAAARAGLKSGDVITSLDGQTVRSAADLMRALRDAKDDQVTIGIMREKKETSLKATVAR